VVLRESGQIKLGHFAYDAKSFLRLTAGEVEGI
jgi:hypothetical protein